jgi:bacillithiol system protein YtxJ
MNWIPLNTPEQLDELALESNENPVLIFKHSTSCSISRTVLDRLQRNYKPQELPGARAYFLDLLAHRNISNSIAQKFDVEHQSPQAILLKNGKVVYAASHFEIDYRKMREAAALTGNLV